MASGVYAIVCQNGHLYIGSAVDIAKRWGHHRPVLRQGKHHSSHLQRAWDKYGESAFRFTVLQECEPEELVAIEQSWMDTLQPEYNIARIAGSCLGIRCTEEKRAKLSAANMGHPGWSKGKKVTEETRTKISAAKKGKPNGLLGKKRPNHSATMMGHEVSQETRDKIAASNTGKKHSAEIRQKMSAAKRGIALSPEHRAKIGAALKETYRTPEGYEQRVRVNRKLQETWGKTPEAHAMHLRVGREIQELAKTPEGREVFARAGHIGGTISGHIRGHVNRGIVNPKCELCKAANP